jgi:hypothetical protein
MKYKTKNLVISFISSLEVLVEFLEINNVE